MNDRRRLERRYRRLLLAFPRVYRRERGPEIVTTLLDAAPDGQRRPTRRETVDLLTSGLRYRFGVRGAGAVFAVVCGVLGGAMAMSALGGFLGWQTAPALPSDADARAIVAPALPPATSAQPQRFDVLFDTEPGAANSWLVGSLDYTNGSVAFDVAGVTDDAIAQTLTRLRAAGWQPTGAREDYSRLPLAYYRDGWRIAFQIRIGPGEHRSITQVALTRDTPFAAKALTTVGLPVGALIGWLLVAAAWRRTRATGPGWLAAVIVTYGIGMLAHFPAALINAYAIVQTYRHPHELYPPWIGYTVTYVRTLAWLAVLLLVSAAVLTRFAPHRKPLRLAA